MLYDINVLMDVLLDRQPHLPHSIAALDAAIKGRVAGHVCADSMSTIFYLARKPMGAVAARKALVMLTRMLRVVPVTAATIDAALQSPMTDFEDAVLGCAAAAADIDLIVTRNLPDFAAGEVTAVTPTNLLAMLRAN